MAATARPGSPDGRDARIPCPLCGGLIHPIAGKCKHCKADLTAYRAARPAANAPLPALHHAGGNPGGNPGNGQPAHAPVAHAVPMPAAYDASQPVLPPRPTSRVPTARPTGTWRSWPILVIVVAMMAIVAAVVLMVWPPSQNRDGKRLLQPPPAPERMDTQTPPVTPRVDPPKPHASRDPWSPQPSDPPPDPSTAQTDPDDVDLDAIDPFDSAHPSPGRRRLTLNAGSRLALAMTAHLCRRLAQCGNTDPTMQNTCEAIARWPSAPPTSCPAAERCLRQIDTLSCGSPADVLQMGTLFTRLSDCADAMQC